VAIGLLRFRIDCYIGTLLLVKSNFSSSDCVLSLQNISSYSSAVADLLWLLPAVLKEANSNSHIPFFLLLLLLLLLLAYFTLRQPHAKTAHTDRQPRQAALAGRQAGGQARSLKKRLLEGRKKKRGRIRDAFYASGQI
jgi:hypothetical protein